MQDSKESSTVSSSVPPLDELDLDTDQQAIYRTTYELINTLNVSKHQYARTTDLPLLSLVPVTSEQETNIRHSLPFHRVTLERAKQLEKREAQWIMECDDMIAPGLISPLTLLLTTGSTTATSQGMTPSTHPLQSLQTVTAAVPRRVCQHPFRKNDIVWVCRTCQADETCVLCHACFSQSDHTNHDVHFYHAQAGGCCDCGDPDGVSWKYGVRI